MLALPETITVSGEAPIVDVTNSRRQQTISGDVIAAIPSSRRYFGLTTLVPALNIQGNDIGGASGPIFSVFQIHGGRRNEGQVLVDGLSMGFQGMGVSFYVPEVGTAQEVTFSLSGGLGEAPTGGPQMNIVPRAGGNVFSGSLFVTGANGAMQGDNITQEIRDAGLTGRNELKKLWEVNPALGGPIRGSSLVLWDVPSPGQSAARCRHVREQERGGSHEVDLRSDLASSSRRRRHVEERVAASDLAGNAAQQGQRLVGRADRVSTASAAAHGRAWCSPAAFSRPKRTAGPRASRSEWPRRHGLARLESAAARGQSRLGPDLQFGGLQKNPTTRP